MKTLATLLLAAVLVWDAAAPGIAQTQAPITMDDALSSLNLALLTVGATPLSISAVSIVAATPVAFGPVVRTALPATFGAHMNESTNCSPIPAMASTSLSVPVGHTSSIALSQSAINTLGIKIPLSMSFGKFSVNAEVVIAPQATSVTSAVVPARVPDVSAAGTVTVPGLITAAAEMVTFPIQYVVPFTTTVLVDGDVSGSPHVKHAGDVLSIAERTFTIHGTLTAVDATDARLMWANDTFDKAYCSTFPKNGIDDTSVRQRSVDPAPTAARAAIAAAAKAIVTHANFEINYRPPALQ